MKVLRLSLSLSLSLSLALASLSGCTLSPEERRARAQQMWAAQSPPIAARIASLQKAAAAANDVKDVPEFVLGARPALLLGYPRNTLVVKVGEVALPSHAHAFRDGNPINDDKEYLQNELENAIKEVDETRYLAVIRPQSERKASFEDSKMEFDKDKKLNMTVHGGDTTVEVLVFDVVDDMLLGRHEVSAHNSATVTGSYTNPEDNMAEDLQKQMQSSVEAWLQYGTKPGS